ncbi:hypothetical protein AGLY_005047 [Aphis glycines]|uniref:Uncharacterized protein n=1 Tax=Aphis glycines TaxID=307491 RepID=A0A6G0TVL3_APHGL|nr:hypothetical protein AGLY_005047 [Aphis glycines]
MEVALHQPGQRLLELVVGQRVAERVDGAVGVAQEVREQEQPLVGARRVGAEALDERQDVVRRPAGHERAQYERYGPERFPRPVLGLGLLPARHFRPFHLQPFADGPDKVAARTALSLVAAASAASAAASTLGRLGRRFLAGTGGRRVAVVAVVVAVPVVVVVVTTSVAAPRYDHGRCTGAGGRRSGTAMADAVHDDGRVDLGDDGAAGGRVAHLLSRGRPDERGLQQRRRSRGTVGRRTLGRRHGLVHRAGAIGRTLERRRPDDDRTVVHEVQLAGVHADERVHPTVGRRRRRVGRRLGSRLTAVDDGGV